MRHQGMGLVTAEGTGEMRMSKPHRGCLITLVGACPSYVYPRGQTEGVTTPTLQRSSRVEGEITF